MDEECFSRKGAKRCRVSMGFLCAFAPLREKYSRVEVLFGQGQFTLLGMVIDLALKAAYN